MKAVPREVSDEWPLRQLARPFHAGKLIGLPWALDQEERKGGGGDVSALGP